LFLSLCLPDICGSLETPNEDVGVRYKRWFKLNLATKYEPMFSADDCYYFRCSCLHQGAESHINLAHERIHFIPPPPRANIIHLNKLNDVLQMQIDIFCNDIADATDKWHESIAIKDEAIRTRLDSLIKVYDIKSLEPFISFGD